MIQLYYLSILYFDFHHKAVLNEKANELMIEVVFWIICSPYFFGAS